MAESLSHIFSRISLFHLNILLLLGLALFCATVGGRLFQKLRIPQVVGYIAIGILIGESGLKIVDHSIIGALQPFNYFALGLIGFMVGGELKKDIFVKYGKQFMKILLCEGIAPFILVTVLVGFFGGFIFGWKVSWALGLLLGAISSATDPATTTEVLKEYKTRGPLTRTILGIVALDDGLALILFAIASSVASVLSGHIDKGLLQIFLHPFYDIGSSILLGLIAGVILNKILQKYSEKERILVFTIGLILIVVGVSLAIKAELLLSVMTVGILVSNFSPGKSKEVFNFVEGFSPPIYVLFFVLIGAKLNFSHMSLSALLLVGIYLFGTMFGKAIGSKLGSYISAAPQTVKKYLPFALFSQAGVAIGLSILAAHYFPGEIGNTLIVVITATTFFLQLIGPALTKFSVIKAKEAGLNVTEEDLIEKMTAKDVMDANPPLIYKNMPLAKILEIFSQTNNLYYPVVDIDRKVLGIITVDSLKNIFNVTSLSELLLAIDFMEPIADSVKPDSSLTSVKCLFTKYNLEYLPVTKADNAIEGFIERRLLNKFISAKLIDLQRRVDSLEHAS